MNIANNARFHLPEIIRSGSNVVLKVWIGGETISVVLTLSEAARIGKLA